MNDANGIESPHVRITVELYGSARLASGRRTVAVTVHQRTRRSDVAGALALACPELLGVAVREDGSDLAGSYTFNLNGHQFVADYPVTLADGDSLLLFSSLSGG